MACFLVPAAEAVVATIATKAIKKKEEQALTVSSGETLETSGKLPFSRKLKWLTNLLWGGSALLAFEHLWHGEITPYPPFLTGASEPAEMFTEMATNGVGMAALVTVVWAVIVAVTGKLANKQEPEPETAAEGT